MNGDRDRREKDVFSALKRAAKNEEAEDEGWWTAVVEGRADALPDDAPSLEILRPLDAAEQEQIVDLLLNAPKAKTAKVIPFRRAATMGAVVAVVSAAAAGWLLVPRASAPLPPYAMELRGGERDVRGEQAPVDVPRYTEGSVISAVFRPAEVTASSPELMAILAPEGGAPRTFAPNVERAEGGALRLTATVTSDWALTPGRHRLVFLVGPSEALPSGPDAALGTPRPGVQRFVHVFEYVSLP